MSDSDLKPCPSCGYAPVHCGGTTGTKVDCYNCGMSGPRHENQSVSKAAWNALPRRLRWTTETPTEPDFYWHRDEGILSIAYIFGDTQDNLLCHFAGEEHPTPLILITGEWAGPIPQPQEQP